MTRQCLVSDRQRPRFRFARAGALAAMAVTLSAAAAHAQSNAHGFSLNRFEPSGGGSDWFSLESIDFRGNGRPALGVVGDWAYKPLVLYNRDGSEKLDIVEQQLQLHVGFALNF